MEAARGTEGQNVEDKGLVSSVIVLPGCFALLATERSKSGSEGSVLVRGTISEQGASKSRKLKIR